MRLLNSFLSLLAVDTFDFYTQLDIEHEAALAILSDAYFRRYGRGRMELALAEDKAKGTVEAGGIARGEELFGVCCPALSAKFLRSAKLDVEETIITYCVTFATATGDTSRSRVESFECHNLLFICVRALRRKASCYAPLNISFTTQR